MISQDDFDKIQTFKASIFPLFVNGVLSPNDWNASLNTIIDKVLLKEQQCVETCFQPQLKPQPELNLQPKGI